MERFDLTKIQVEAISTMLRDEFGEDDQLLVDTLEGETDMFEWIRRLLDGIEEDEGNQAQLAEQIACRQERKKRAEHRINARRQAIQALLECARQDKLTLPEATLSVRKVAPKPIVTDETALPDEFCKFVRKPDMAAIKEADWLPPGVALDNGGTSLTIRRK